MTGTVRVSDSPLRPGRCHQTGVSLGTSLEVEVGPTVARRQGSSSSSTLVGPGCADVGEWAGEGPGEARDRKRVAVRSVKSEVPRPTRRFSTDGGELHTWLVFHASATQGLSRRL